MARLHGKIAVVTGGAQGIGRGIADLFSAEGACVTVLDVTPGAGLTCDIAIESQVDAAFNEITARYGGVDILINNAGIGINGKVTVLSAAQWDRQLAVNLRGAFLCSRAAIRSMSGRGGGAIVNIASVHATVSWPTCVPYDTTKAGLLGFTRALALDHGKDGIRVNCICPGYIDTPHLKQAFEAYPDPDAERRRVLAAHPLGRIGLPRDIADACLFLCSDAASFITGASLVVDGGMTLAGH
jgi:NAD(P)-dependent dehydrogenase (short-subunit alcohol dehydrogenase family)